MAKKLTSRQEDYKNVLRKISSFSAEAATKDGQEYDKLEEAQKLDLTLEERILLAQILMVVMAKSQKLKRDEILNILRNVGINKVAIENFDSEILPFSSSKRQARQDYYDISCALEQFKSKDNKIELPKNFLISAHAAACQLAVLSGAMRLIPQDVSGRDLAIISSIIFGLSFATSYTNYHFINNQLVDSVKKTFSEDFTQLSKNKVASFFLVPLVTLMASSSAFVDASY